MPNAAIRQQDPLAARRARLGAILAFILRIQERWQQRRHLEELDDHLLDDIGLKPEDVRCECRKAFWQ